MPKQVFRDALLAQRLQFPEEERRELSRVAQLKLVASSLFMQARSIALYSPTRGEVATELLFYAARQSQKMVCFPRVVDDRMVFVEVDDQRLLSKGAFNLLEPQGGSSVPVADLDMMVVPGVAFDRTGHRLGYGKGFYDRELHSVGFSGVLIGLCFEFQIVDRLPAESHDIPVDFLVTEQGLFSPLHPSDVGGSP